MSASGLEQHYPKDSGKPASNTQHWRLEQQHSELQFKAKHMMIANVRGQFKQFDVEVETEGDDFFTADIQVTIDVNSIDTGVSYRDQHLRSADFFDAENYPKIYFRAKDGLQFDEEEDELLLPGELTIRDVTKPITLKVEYGGKITDLQGTERAGFSLEGQIDRFDFNLVWNYKLASGSAVVGRNIKLFGEIQLVKDTPATQKQSEFQESISAAVEAFGSQIPDISKLEDEFSMAFALFEPKAEVGGDFYWFTQRDNQTIIFLGDGVGHAMEGSLKAMMGISILNQLEYEKGELSPEFVLKHLHKGLRNIIEHSRAANPELYAMEAGALVIDHHNKSIHYSGAGIPLIRLDQEGEVGEYKTPHVGLGSQHFEESHLPRHTFLLQSDDAYYLFTDGIVDQFGGKNDKKLGHARLKDWLTATSYMDKSHIERYLQDQLRKWQGTNEPTDDRTLIGIQV